MWFINAATGFLFKESDMSEAKFERKGWEILSSYQVGFSVDYGDGFFTVASCQVYDKGKANAHLIAAAPEMYDLLERVKEVMLNTYDVTDYPADGNTDCDVCAREIDALLTKARGE